MDGPTITEETMKPKPVYAQRSRERAVEEGSHVPR